MPQLPQVSQGDSSIRLITVALLVGVGVGEGDGPVPGVGVGAALDDETELVLVEDEELPPHEASSRDIAKIAEQVCAAFQIFIGGPPANWFLREALEHCNPWGAILDYVESLRLGDYSVTGGHRAMREWHMTLAGRRLTASERAFRSYSEPR